MVELNSAETTARVAGLIPNILMPLPDRDFDPTEVPVPWKVCTSRGWRVAFSTEHGSVAQGEVARLKGPLPGVLSGSVKARAAYPQMTQDPAYQHPIPYADIDPDQYQAILLPGGDAPPMRQYLDSQVLRDKVLQFWQRGKLIGAICHGMLVAARTVDPQTGRSILYGHKVTALPKQLDLIGYRLAPLTLKREYIMYPKCVAEEVRACLERPEDFSSGPGLLTPYAVSDGNLITARWYLDAELFAERFAEALEQYVQAESKAALAGK